MTNRKAESGIDGVLVVDKPVGPTSHDVVATARRTLRVRRVGHTGTLDPNASGVLPLVLGRATRLAQHLTASDKEYQATITFGVETDSYDSTGHVVRETRLHPTAESIAAALTQFRGAFAQTPPAFSAKKIDGGRAYDLARRAQAVQLRAVPVVAHALELVSFEAPRARLRLVCSAGFYVRSLAHDLGRVLGTGAILEGLVRTRAGVFALADAVPFGEVAAAQDAGSGVLSRVIPLEGLLLDLPAVVLTMEGVRRVAHGMELRPSDFLIGGGTHACAAPAKPDGGGTLASLPPGKQRTLASVPPGKQRTLASLPPEERGTLTIIVPRTVRLLAPDGRLLGLAEPSKTPGSLHPAVVFG